MPITDTQRMIGIDVARTGAILLMVLYHLLFDLQYWYGTGIDVHHGLWFWVGRASAVLFLFLVGISFVVSTRRRTPRQIEWRAFQRAAVILSWAVAISMVTYLLDRDTYIRFGILHCIGISVLLLLPLYRFGVMNLLFAIAWFVATPVIQGSAPDEFLLPLGRVPAGFATLDFYPLFPWAGWVLLGAGVAPLLLRWHRASDAPVSRMLQVLTWPGRHALGVYLVHQPVLLALLWVAARIGLLG